MAKATSKPKGNGKVETNLKEWERDLSFDEFKELYQKYWELLSKNPFPTFPADGDVIKTIYALKRKEEGSQAIGPYRNITVFEAANRIASDLVILNGIFQIIESDLKLKDSKIRIHFGSTHIKGEGDFKINEKIGEAFNVAPSFYAGKLWKTLDKWKKERKKLEYILVNGEVVPEQHQVLDKFEGITIVPVRGWDQKQ